MTTSRSESHFGAKISREIVISTTEKFYANVPNPRTKQSWKVMKTSVCRRKLLRICKSTENHMQTDVTKQSRLIFTVIDRLVKTAFQMLTNERFSGVISSVFCHRCDIAYGGGPSNVDFCHAYCTDKYFAMPLNIVFTVASFSPVVQGEPERQAKISVHL